MNIHRQYIMQDYAKNVVTDILPNSAADHAAATDKWSWAVSITLLIGYLSAIVLY